MSTSREPGSTANDSSSTDVEVNQAQLPQISEKQIQSPPDGGLASWLAVLGGACIYFSTLGYANSFGVFQQYYETHQLAGDTPDNIAWIGSLANFLQFGFGAFTGALFDRLGPWVSNSLHFLFVSPQGQ